MLELLLGACVPRDVRVGRVLLEPQAELLEPDDRVVEPAPGEHVGQAGGVVGDRVELRVLRQVAEGAGVVHDARVGRGGAAEDPQQGGLAGAVAADEADLVAGADGEAGVLHEETAAHFDREPADLQHPPSAPQFAGAATAETAQTARGSVDLALAALPVVGAELELLELAGGGAGEVVAELDRRRALEVRQTAAAVLDELLLGRLGARREHDQAPSRSRPTSRPGRR